MFEVVFTRAAGFCASGDGEATKDFVFKKRTPEPSKVDSEQWKPPNSSELKVNVDGSLDEIRSEGSIACVCRDYTGKLVDGFVKESLCFHSWAS